MKISRKSDNFGFASGEIKKLNVLFSVKKQAKGKMDSNFYLFLGFCRKINPKFIVDLDAGIVPEPGRTLVNLITPMENDMQIAATCGETQVKDKNLISDFKKF